MLSITCPHCSRIGSLKAATPNGTRVRCPGCQKIFEVQSDSRDWEASTPNDRGVDLNDSLVSGNAPPSSNVSFAGIADNADPASSTPVSASDGITISSDRLPFKAPIPPEPWYYNWLDIYADILRTSVRFITVLISILFGTLGVLAFAPGINNGHFGFSFLAIAYLIGSYIIILLGFVPVLVFLALTKLAVDVARNIRATRYQQ